MDEFALFSLGWGNEPLTEDVRAGKPFKSPAISRLQGEDLIEAVLARSGATLPRRDAVDRRIVENFKTKQGRMINSPLEVGGFLIMAGGEPPIDSDHDGMPDDWEKKAGLNPQDPKDAAADQDGDGYTNIEEYLHSLSKWSADGEQQQE